MVDTDSGETNVEEESAGDDEERPFVSVVIPVYEDAEGVAVTLESLVEQTYPTDRHEVVVVDNGSSDGTPAVVDAFADAYGHVRSLVEPAGGSYAARNAGVRAARGSILSFVDADVTVAPDWLESVVARLAEIGASALACDVELAECDGHASLSEAYNRRTAFPIREYVEEWGFAPTCCLTVRRAVVEDVGGFDARLVSSGDREFGDRLTDAGYELAFAPDLTVTHPPRTSVRALVDKAERIGHGKYQVRRYYPDRYGRPTTRLANPATYTPPLPGSMVDHVRGWAGLPSHRRLAFGLLAWVLTLSKAVGSWREALDDGGRESVVAPSPDVGSE